MDSSDSDTMDSDDEYGLSLFDIYEEKHHRTQPRRGKELCTCGAAICAAGRWARQQAKEGALLRAILRNDAAQVAALLAGAGCWPDRVLQRTLKMAASEEICRVFAFAAPSFWERGGGAEALLWAAAEGRAEAVRALLAAGIEPDAKAPWDKARALPAACRQGHTACVEELLDRGADVHRRLDYDFTPLHLAAQSGEAGCVRALVRRGARPATKTCSGFSPLDLAARAGAVHCVRALLEAGADPNARCYEKDTALHLAASTPCYAMNNPSRYRFERTSAANTLANFSDCILELVNAGANVNAVNSKNSTPLALALNQTDITVIRTLIDSGANLHHRLFCGITILHRAAMSPISECVAAILERSNAPYVDVTDDGGDTPLLTAIRLWNTDAVEELLRFGADPTRRDEVGNTALHIAADLGFCAAARALLRAGADVDAIATDNALTPLHVAAHVFDVVEVLLEAGADVNRRSANGRTPLQYDLHGTDHRSAKLLLSHGADPLARDDAGWTVLHHAANEGATCKMELYLQWGLSPADRTDDGRTALHVAAGSMQTDCVLHLLRNLGANANERDATGRTPLHLAARAANEEMVRALLLAGAERTPRDDFGDAPADVAVADYLKRLIRSWALAA